MADSGENPLALTPKQARAIPALMCARNVADAAKAANVAERTLYRWLGDPVFRLRLNEAEGEAIDTATRRLLQLQDPAIDALDTILQDPEAAPTVRLRAATAVLDYLIRLRELRNVEARLLALEAAQAIEAGGGNE